MKQRKRRRTMRPPIDSSQDNAPVYFHKRRPSDRRLCINGACTVYGCNDVPTSFSPLDKGEYLKCNDAGLEVSYVGPARSGQDEKFASSIRTDLPIPSTAIALYYFEITVSERGDKGQVGVGLCLQKTDLVKMPGWQDGSYGYHGDDGQLYNKHGDSGKDYGPKYGTDDVIGCCWDIVENQVFFTFNGEKLGVAFSGLIGSYYPTVGMQSNNAKIIANFGSKRFKFDIETYANQQREKVLNAIIGRTLDGDYRLLSDTVLSYLMHNGYAKTAAAFAKDAGREQLFLSEKELMTKRQAICDKVISGDIDGAIENVESEFPQVMENHLNVSFLLHTQKFIEMIISGCSPEEPVKYGQEKLSKFKKPKVIERAETQDIETGGAVGEEGGKKLAYDDILKDVYLLLAYGDPANSPSGYLTKQSRRDMVADRLNSAILATQGRPMRSVLERFICHNRNVLSRLVSMDNGPAALVSEDDIL